MQLFTCDCFILTLLLRRNETTLLEIKFMDSAKENKSALVVIDLETELAPEELIRFREKAAEAKAASLSEHFKNVFLRVPRTEQAS